MHFKNRQWLSREGSKRFLATIGLGVLLGFAGPFGSYPNFPTATRYAFWIGLTIAGALAAVAANAVLPVNRLCAGAARVGLVTLVSSVPMTFVVAWAMSLVQPGRTYTPQQLATLFWGVAAVQLVVVYVTTAARPAAVKAEEPVRAPADAAAMDEALPAVFPNALLNKLPPGSGADIIALETEDHYLRVHMADATALLDPRLGAQVHRRWWVAQEAVAGLQTEGQKLSLRLTDGSIVPIGRTFALSARARFAKASARLQG